VTNTALVDDISPVANKLGKIQILFSQQDRQIHRSDHAEFQTAGITPRLVEMTRQTLDNHGYGHVKIIVSGGFSPDRIAEFEKRRVPVDAYGVGTYLMLGVNAFTADVVLLEGKASAKVGRAYKPNSRLE
jgi:nicotinate phosphoribosyltransferase